MSPGKFLFKKQRNIAVTHKDWQAKKSKKVPLLVCNISSVIFVALKPIRDALRCGLDLTPVLIYAFRTASESQNQFSARLFGCHATKHEEH